MIRGIPYDHQLEYLESTGSQYIDTGLRTSSTNTEYDITYHNVTYLNSSGRYLQGWSTARSDYWGINGGVYETGTTKSSIQKGQGDTVQFIRSGLSVTLKINGYTAVSKSNVGLSYGPLQLFALSGGYNGPLKMGRVIVYDSSGLAGDYIPVSVNGVAKMYDRVTGTFPRHYGTFVAGPVASTPLMGVHMYPTANLWKWPTQTTTGSASPTSVWTPILDIVYPRVSSNGYVNNTYPYDPFVAGPNTIVSTCNSGYGAAVFRALPPGKYKISADISLYSGSATNASILAIDYAPSAGQWVYSRYVGSGNKPFGVISTSFTVESGHLTAISFFCGVQSTSILVKDVSLIEVP